MLDPRQGHAPVAHVSLPYGQAALSIAIGFDGYIAAVGSNKARINFFDLRSTRLLGAYVDSHTNMIPTLSFRPESASTLVSGSEDGLLCVFDTKQPTEDSALQTVLNVGAPVRKIGFCGDTNLYCLTGSETASLWNYESAMCIQDFGVDLRHQLALHVPSLQGSIDYLVDAHWDNARQELVLMAGNSQGGAALYRLDHQHQQQLHHNATLNQKSSLQWELCNILEGGHRGVVRDVCHLSQSVLLTAGEDARICEWNRGTPQAHAAKSLGKPVDVARTHREPAQAYAIASSNSNGNHCGGGGPIRRPRSRQKAAPY
jgi:WD40 repeat protein